jgi:hypothetical protein
MANSAKFDAKEKLPQDQNSDSNINMFSFTCMPKNYSKYLNQILNLT